MNEVKTTLSRLSLYYLLLALNILPCASILPDVFPTRNVSTLYLLVLTVIMIRYYSYRLLPAGLLSVMMRSLSWMAFFLILLRALKYSVFAGVPILARHMWYLYYVPMLLIPLLFFGISLLVSPKDGSPVPRVWYAAAAITAVLIVLVLTNDLHEQIFRFAPGFADWDNDYTYGWTYFLIFAWQFVLYLATVVLLVFKCRVGSAKKYAWLTGIPFLTGIVMIVLLLIERMPRLNGTYIIEFPEALIFMVAGVLECCMQLGLIPTNKGYGKLFGLLSLSAQITDRKGAPVYLSRTATALIPAQFAASDGTRVDAHTVLHKMEVPGGYGFWQDDITEIDRLNEELEEAKEGLSQEAELIRLRCALREKQTRIEQRTAMYDTIARRTARQSQAIYDLAETGRLSSDRTVKETCCARITLLAAYLKRYANLVLLSYESRTIETGELGLSFSEVLRYLNFAGIPGELVNTAAGTVPAEAALAVFETFGTLLEADLDSLRGAFVNLSSKERTVCKLTLENLQAAVPAEESEALSRAGVTIETVREDDVAYVSFTFPEGGRAV